MPKLMLLADKYNDDTAEYDQTVSIKGAVVSQISTGASTLSIAGPSQGP